jgi:transcriptional regulator with XRE-family HTH domain
MVAHFAHHGACFPTLDGWQTPNMKTRKPVNYLRSYRLRWGLSQGELANLLGWKGAEVVSRIEKKQRPPTLKLVIACFILFGAPAAELFPDISASIDIDVMARVWEMYEKIQGDPSRKTKMKIELLEGAIRRAEQRKHAPRS